MALEKTEFVNGNKAVSVSISRERISGKLENQQFLLQTSWLEFGPEEMRAQ